MKLKNFNDDYFMKLFKLILKTSIGAVILTVFGCFILELIKNAELRNKFINQTIADIVILGVCYWLYKIFDF